MLANGGVRVLKPNEVLESNGLIGSYITFPSLKCILILCKNKLELKNEIQAYVGFGDLWMPERTSARPFGQREELVTRLKNILSTYPEKNSVLKEILQNADDARASEVHFVYDRRNHKTNTIFKGNWKPLQGPALCVFNDACFTEKDLEGIKNLGIGSKAEDRSKTGQFGLGFNAVYHLTDAPMILSVGQEAALGGGMFCVLDPHCRYAPKADVNGPGMVMEVEELQTKQRDIFDTFLTSRALKNTSGTWFRFPLRSVEMAPNSNILQKACSNEDMIGLLTQMVFDIKEGMFFLLNVSKITISMIGCDGKETVMGRVKVERKDTSQQQHLDFKTCLSEYNDLMRSIDFETSLLPIRDFRYFIDVKDEIDNSSTRWFLVQTLGFSHPEQIDSRLQESIKSKEIQILPRGGVAMLISTSSKEHKSVKPKAFCLLPLEIETGLTGHINGQFAVDMSRSTLWGSDIENSNAILANWNLSLIRWNIAYAYALCIDFLRDHFCPSHQASANLEQYLSLFPLYSEAKNDFWKELVYHLFFHFKLLRLEVFPILTCNASDDFTVGERNEKQVKWISRHKPTETCVLVDDLSHQSIHQKEVAELHDTLVELGMKLICIPIEVCSGIIGSCNYYHQKQKRFKLDWSIDTTHKEQNCVCIERISPMAAIQFFKSYQSNKSDRFQISSLKLEQVKICLNYCLKVGEWQFLNEVPLLISENECITCFLDKNDLMFSKFYYLLPTSSDKFVHTSLLQLLYPYKGRFAALTWERFSKLLPESMPSSKCQPRYSELLLATESDINWCKGFWKFVDETIDSKSVKSVQDLKDWCLLPVILNSTKYLFPLSWCKYTVLYDSFAIYPYLFQIFTELNLPTPIIESRVLKSLVATYENSENMLSSLFFWRNEINSIALSNQQCFALIMYLIMNMNSTQRAIISKLKALRLFTSFNGDRINLPENGLFVLDFQDFVVPTCGVKELFKRLEMTVIVDIDEIWATKLFKLLGCNRLNAVTLYVNYILPRLGTFTEEGIMFHLEFVNKKLLNDSKLISVLPSFDLIPSDNHGSMKKGSHFYDPECAFFVSMCGTSELPPQPFCNIYWRRFMVCAGMNTTLTEKILLTFAKKISHMSSSESVEQKSKSVVREFVKYVNRKKVSGTFLTEISKIPFIVINTYNSRYEEIHESFHTGVILICYCGTLSSCNMTLAWTSATVLPKYATPNSNIAHQLKIQDVAKFETVELHTRNLSSRLKTTCPNHDQNLIEEIMTDIYSYFSRFIYRIPSLRTIPIIHHKKHKLFVRGDQIVENLSTEDEISPHLLKAPVNYGKFFELFGALGMRDSPDSDTYCRVLDDIKKISRDKCLIDTSLLECTRLAMKGLMQCLQKLKTPLDDLAVDTLYILSEKYVLKSSSVLYYDSLEVSREELRHIKDVSFIADLRCIGLNVAQLDSLFKYLPVKNRPLSVTSILSINVELGNIIENEKATALQESLTSDIFIMSILRIIKHDHLKNCRVEMTEGLMTSISATLRRLRVNVVTRLLTHHENKEKRWSSVQQERPCFFEDTKTILYINDKDFGIDQWLHNYDVELEREIKRICEDMFDTGSLMSVLGQIVTNLRGLDEKLTSLGIPFLEDDVLKKIWFPLPGSLVPRELLHLLRKPSQQMAIQEYAVIKHPGDDAFNLHDIDSSEDVIFIYCIVTGYDSVTYTVNVGKSFDIKVHKDNMYVIRQEPSDDDASGDNSYTFTKEKPYVRTWDDFDGHGTASYARGFFASGKPNPQKQEGRVWLKQALCDFKTGTATIDGIDNFREEVKGYNWVCLMCQQAAEKAIKGAQYATDSNKVFRSHVLYENIPDGDGWLDDTACELSHVVKNINRLRYPDYNGIPADLYSEEDARKALRIAKNVLSHVERVYFYDV